MAQIEIFTPERIAALVHLTDTSEVLTITLLALCTLAAVLRGYVKLCIVRLFRLDDALLLGAYVLYAALAATMIMLCVAWRQHATGTEGADHRVTILIKIFPTLYVLCSVVCKTSFGIMLFNIFETHHRVSSLITIALCVIPAVLGIAYIGISWTCGVRHDHSPEEARQCRYTDAAAVVSVVWSSSNALADVGFALLSIYTVWLASLPRRVRIVTGILLSFGSVAAAVSIRRVIAEVGFVTDAIDESRLFICLYSIMEAGISISAVCLATMKPLLQRLKSLCRGSAYNTSAGSAETYTIGSTKRRILSRTKSKTQGWGSRRGGIMSETKKGREPWMMLSATTTTAVVEAPALADHGKLLV